MASRRIEKLARKFDYLLNFLRSNNVRFELGSERNLATVYIPVRPRAEKELKDYIENYLEKFGYNWYYDNGRFRVLMTF